MSDPGFFDGLVLGALLLGVLFGFIFVGALLTPLWWILVIIGWPLFAGVVILYEVLRGTSRWVPAPGGGPASFPALRCGVCGAPTPVGSQACPACGAYVRPRSRWSRPPPMYCRQCGTLLEGTSRYRRGFCPSCREFR